MKKRYIVLLSLLGVFITIQFIGNTGTNPDFNPESDYFNHVSADSHVMEIVVSTCYDCHSNETDYPWYAKVAPVSWWIQNHIDDGRKHLNFSLWGTYTEKRKNHKAEELVEVLEEGIMPLDSYKILHHEARLTEDQIMTLIAFFKEQIQ